ncbi:MAG: UpxY family transcription antiterminator [Ferruginibacter sp.]|nr:UpxY family transcription antiterminator [Ferruginibacter sp.]
MIEEKKWYVIYSRPRWEKKVASLLVTKGIEHYCPLNKVMRQWSDRKKNVFEPLFKGYVFVLPDDVKTWDIKSIAGIVNFVYWLGKPAVVKEEEINIIKKFLHEFDDVKVTDDKLVLNDAVVIKQGLLMNYKGIVLEVIGNSAKVKIQGMGLTLTALFDKKNLQKKIKT